MAISTTALVVAGAGDPASGARQPRSFGSQTTTIDSQRPSTTSTNSRRARSFGTTTPTTSAPTTTTPAPAPTAVSELRPVGSPVLSDADAASRVRRSGWEPRPDNAIQNQTVPTAAQLSTFHSYTGQWGNCDHLRQKVTGNFRGTTDEIIQWAAWKWGLPEDTVRAAAASESWWRMSTVGDNGMSFGLMQIKSVERWHGGTFPLSRDATAFNADYYAGMVRHYFEGCATWLKDYSYNGFTYGAGDLWGSVGAWYSGDWHSNASHSYVNDVYRNQTNRVWATSGF
ncbi:MAG: hypothetical protein KY395_04675 [Actinobacteria bacterium]|nr:hypothetical protein [Actinomycetota bacterium]